jgi:formamidopyrimidine-DNA glycosylase
LPELPDVVVYIEALTRHIAGRRLERIRLLSPFVLRSVDPPIATLHGQTVRDVRRIGKRIVLVFDPSTLRPSDGLRVVPSQVEGREPQGRGDDDLFLVIHLMIAGRLRWREPGKKPGMGPKMVLASFEYAHGTLFFTEASSQKRASMQLVRGEAALNALDPGGIEPLDATLEQFHDALTRENHTLKRALTDPHLVSGIGNAYSDEILHAARLSPLKLSRSLSDEEFVRLYDATRATLVTWVDRLRRDVSGGFPEKVTAFRDEMAVHGRFKQPCPVCGLPVQRIVYAANECNYCAKCQTGGRLLADRSLSRLLKDDWPRSIDEI